MYLEFYNLKEKPFSLTPDPSFLYYSNAHRRAIAFLKYGLQESKGFLQLTGPVGSGKTTLLRAVLAELDERTKTAYVINPCATFPDLLRSIMKDLEIPDVPKTRLKIELLDFFHDYLLLQMKRSQPVIVIFDEAQNLSIKNLEEIRMLSNFETSKNKLLQIVFVGQPELIKTLDLPELRQLKQRIQVRYHLSSLSQPEVKAYINHRLRVAGSNGEIVFTDDACQAIYDFSGGIPRLINSVCDVMLLVGYVNERKQFDGDCVRESINEMSGSFSDEPSDVAEEISYSKTDETGESPQDEEGELEEDVQPSPKANTVGPPPVVPAPGPEGVLPELSLEEADSNSPVVQTPTQTAAESPLTNEDVPGQPPDAINASTLENAQPGSPDGDGPKVNTTSWFGQLPRYVSFDASRVPGSSFVHSPVRNGPKGKFCAGVYGANKLIEPRKTIPGKIAEFFSKHIYSRNGHPAPANVREGGTAPGSMPEPKLQIKERDQKEYASSADQNPLLGMTDEEDDLRPEQLPRRFISLPVSRRLRPASRPPAKLINSKVMILFKNETVISGIAKYLKLKLDGFQFLPFTNGKDVQEEFIAFEQIIAVRLTDNFYKGWEKKYEMSCHQPKGRQIVAALMNGEIIEGITLHKFDRESQRFFVISPDPDGKTVWTLVERSGTSGIFTESFREGIYSDEADRGDSTAPSKANSEPDAQHEMAGDHYFSIRDYDSALLEYQKAWEITSNVKRITLKISLAHFERGVKCLESNNYDDAVDEFERVVASGYLREKARAKIKRIKKILRGKSLDEGR